jgi:hypothetical protein
LLLEGYYIYRFWDFFLPPLRLFGVETVLGLELLAVLALSDSQLPYGRCCCPVNLLQRFFYFFADMF